MGRRDAAADDAPVPSHGQRVRRNLRDILAAARPHWKPVAFAFLLVAVESFSSTARLVLFLPIFNRVLEGERVETPDPDDDRAQRWIATAETEGGVLVTWLDGVIDGTNDVTRPAVPAAWVEARPEGPEVARERFATLLSVLLLFSMLIVLMCAAAYGETYLSQVAQLRILMDVREAICRKVLDQPIAFFDRIKRGELVQRMLGDVAGYATGLNLVFALVRTMQHLFFPLLALALLSPRLMLVSLVAVPFLAPMRKLSRRTLKRAHRRQQETGRLVEVLLQIVSGIRVVKSFRSEEQRAREFRETDEEVTHRALKVQRAKSTATALITFLNNLLAVLLVIGGGLLAMTGVLPIGVGELTLFVVLLVSMYQPIKRIVNQYNQLSESMASVERTTEDLRLPVGTPDRPDARPFPGVRDAVRFENVSFAYTAGKPVLHGVSFEIPKGGTVALVGPSGGGKSTICDVLLRFHDPTSGRVTIDGVDLADVRRADYLARTAVVTQTPFLFHTSIRENIRQGRPNATDGDVEAAAKAAQIHDDIVATPRGYDEEVGEQGVRLSGGQRQRITIARALIRDPEILVLDEATASLDTASEQAVQRALDSLREGRTTLVVAHRLSTIRDADQILVVDGGRIADRGTHEELIDRGGLYADLVRMQDVSAREGGG